MVEGSISILIQNSEPEPLFYFLRNTNFDNRREIFGIRDWSCKFNNVPEVRFIVKHKNIKFYVF